MNMATLDNVLLHTLSQPHLIFLGVNAPLQETLSVCLLVGRSVGN